MNNFFKIENGLFTSNIIEIGIIYDNKGYKSEKTPHVDIDFFCALLNPSSKLINQHFLVYAGSELNERFLNELEYRSVSYDKSLYGVYSDRLQEELLPEFDATIHVFINKISNEVDKINIFVSSDPSGNEKNYGKESFGSKCNFLICLRDYYTKETIFRYKYNFVYEGKDNIELGKLLKENGKWSFYAFGTPYFGGMSKIIETYL